MNAIKDIIARFRSNQRGAAALELSLALPAFLMLILGTINAGRLMFASSSLNYAVEEAARCSAVNAVLCPTHSTTVSYAQEKYLGPDVDPVFVSSADGCGHTVTVAATFELQVAIMSFDVPISASACYPGVDSA